MRRISLKKLAIGILVTVVVLFALFGIESVPQYRTTKLQMSDVQKEIEFTTNWYPVGYATVSLGNANDIQKFYVKENQKVSKGAVLAKLNDESEYLQYKTAQASYYAAIRAKQSAEDTPMTPDSTIAQLQGQINVAYYQMKNAQAAMNRKLLKAPIAGRVISIVIADYTTGGASSVLSATNSTATNYMIIANTVDPVVNIEVTDKDLVKLTKGMRVVFTNRLNDDELTGKVTTISKSPLSTAFEDPTYNVRVRLDEYPTLPYGTKLEGAIVTAEKSGTTSIQYDAITLDSATTGTVLVLRDGKPEVVIVTVGVVGDDSIEVLAGISETDEIVVDKLEDKKVIAFRPWIRNLFSSK